MRDEGKILIHSFEFLAFKPEFLQWKTKQLSHFISL